MIKVILFGVLFAVVTQAEFLTYSFTCGSDCEEVGWSIVDSEGTLLCVENDAQNPGPCYLPAEHCGYYIKATDSYGDGWSGGQLTIDGVAYEMASAATDTLLVPATASGCPKDYYASDGINCGGDAGGCYTGQTKESCQALCDADDACLAFEVNAGTGECCLENCGCQDTCGGSWEPKMFNAQCGGAKDGWLSYTSEFCGMDICYMENHVGYWECCWSYNSQQATLEACQDTCDSLGESCVAIDWYSYGSWFQRCYVYTSISGVIVADQYTTSYYQTFCGDEDQEGEEMCAVDCLKALAHDGTCHSSCDVEVCDYDGFDCPVPDCNGVKGGTAAVDACGVCGGDNSSCGDCEGVPNGGAVVDECGACGGDNSSCADCAGTPNGNAVVDECGECGGDNSSCADCAGTPNGTAEEDECGVCGGDNSSCADCAGTPNGNAEEDECGVCGGDGSSCASPYNPSLGFNCFVNAGGCHGGQTKESCEAMCDADSQCLAYEIHYASGTCCLEYCACPETCGDSYDISDGIPCNGDAAGWESFTTETCGSQECPPTEGTFGFSTDGYDFTITLHGSVIQHKPSTGETWDLGDYNSGTDSYTGGDVCWDGTARSTTINFACGDTLTVTDVDEPTMCTYVYTATSPTCCDPEPETTEAETTDAPIVTDAPETTETTVVCGDYTSKKPCNAAPENCQWIKWMEPQICINNPPYCPNYHYEKKTCKKLGCVWDKHTQLCGGVDFECSDYHGDKSLCKKRGCTWDKFTELCGVDTEPVCSDYHGDKSMCKKMGCTWDKWTDLCDVETAVVCADYHGDKSTCNKRDCEWNKHMEMCFEQGEEQVPVCSNFDGNKNSCTKFSECEWNKHTDMCNTVGVEEAITCSDYDGDKKTCKKVGGCSWDKTTELCSDE